MKKKTLSEVVIVMGSKTDLPVMREAAKALKNFGIGSNMLILSAHRTPDAVADFSRDARKNGALVIIAGAGGAAHLPGMVAAYTELPVIGVPVPVGPLHGQDALLSIVQMPKGIPVATVAIGNAWNAGVLAAQILGVAADKTAEKKKALTILDEIKAYKLSMKKKVLKKK